MKSTELREWLKLVLDWAWFLFIVFMTVSQTLA